MRMLLIGAAIIVIAATSAAAACEWNAALRLLTCEDVPPMPPATPTVKPDLNSALEKVE
jgi:hypothetical protein